MNSARTNLENRLTEMHDLLVETYDYAAGENHQVLELFVSNTTDHDRVNEIYDFLTKVKILDKDENEEYFSSYHTKFYPDGRIESYAYDMRNGEEMGISNEDLIDVYSEEYSKLLEKTEQAEKIEVLEKQVEKNNKEILVFGTTEKHAKAAAKRAKQDLKERFGLDVSLGEAQQFWAHSNFNMSWQEAMSTIIKNPKHSIHKNEEVEDKFGDVVIVEVASESMLFINGYFETSTYDNTDAEVPYKTVEGIAEIEARKLNTTVRKEVYNDDLPEDWEYDNIADILYLKNIIKREDDIITEFKDKSIFRVDDVIFEEYGLVGDWEQELDSKIEDNEYEGVLILMLEAMKDYIPYEADFTVGEFLKAQKLEDGTWNIGDKNVEIIQ